METISFAIRFWSKVGACGWVGGGVCGVGEGRQTGRAPACPAPPTALTTTTLPRPTHQHAPPPSPTHPCVCVRVCVQGEMAAMFLRHEGFLGAVGAFMRVKGPGGPQLATGGWEWVGGRAGGGGAMCYQGPLPACARRCSSLLPADPSLLPPPPPLLPPLFRPPTHPPTLPPSASTKEPRKVRARFVERFSMGAPVMGGHVQGPAITGERGQGGRGGGGGVGRAGSARAHPPLRRPRCPG